MRKRIMLLLAAVLAFSVIGATWFDGHGKAETNYAQVRLSTGQLCNPGTCTIFVQDDSTNALRSAVTGTNTGYNGGHYVYPNFNFVNGPWSANAYITDYYNAYVTVWARMPCGGGGFQYTPGDFFYHQNTFDQISLGNLTLSGHCQAAAPVGAKASMLACSPHIPCGAPPTEESVRHLKRAAPARRILRPSFCQGPLGKAGLSAARPSCGGGGMPYCDGAEVGVILYATWVWFPNATPQYPLWQARNWKCSYGTAATTERNLTIQAGIDPNSGPGKAWMPQ